ncbi:phosphonate C-P lyase system protein PhnH [Macrococcus capreoli]
MTMYVHEMTRMFRQVMDALSKPGVINAVDGIAHQTTYHNTMYLLLQTLLDNEVTFHLLDGQQGDIDEIKMLMNCRHTSIGEADYIIMKQHEIEYTERLTASRCGTYADPEQSATWIIQLDDFTSGDVYQLTGPGIQTHTNVTLPGVKELLSVRHQLCQSFPLGVDLIFVTDTQVMCIPRTTVVKEVE